VLIRFGFVLAILGEIVGALIGLYAALEKNTPLFFVAWFALVPCMLFVLGTVLSVCAFPFNYSWLGRLLPSDPPLDWQPTMSLSSAIKIGNHFQGSISQWHIGGQGIQLVLWPLGKVFIPLAQIVSIRKQSGWWHAIEHASPEVRGPILVTGHLAEAVAKALPAIPMLR
jgi:hypothetical protein